MAGTTAPAVAAIRFIPPRITAPTKIMRTTPVACQGIPRLASSTWATELDCTVFAKPKPAIAPKIAKAVAKGRHFLLSPFLM